MPKRNKTYKIFVVNGVEGPSIYLNDFRIAGPKPWGGGAITHAWELTDEDLAMAIMTPGQRQTYLKNKK